MVYNTYLDYLLKMQVQMQHIIPTLFIYNVQTWLIKLTVHTTNMPLDLSLVQS